MIHHIIAIVGSSGAGKTTIALAMQQAGIPQIVSYTTRPTRQGETNGVEHHFVTEAEADVLIKQHSLAAYTEINGYRYFTLTRQLQYRDDACSSSKPQHLHLATYVVDERGLQDLMQMAQDASKRGLRHQYDIIPVYIERNLPDRVRDCGWERVRRDAEREPLPHDVYVLRVFNNAQSVRELNAWSYAFAVALFVTMHPSADRKLHRTTLYTSDNSTASIINSINDISLADL